VTACLICERVALAREGRSPHLIAEMDHSCFVVGDHQWHQGYALVLLKEHVREPFELPANVQRAHFREVMRAAEALNATFRPRKLNFSCYGNAEPHVHWHIVPRYEDDPHPGKDPWEDIARFGEKTITADEARGIAERIRGNLAEEVSEVAPVDGCIACDLASGRVPLPGGRIHETRHWLIEHSVAPLGVGTLLVKPKRHVVHVADLEQGEEDELGGVLRMASAAVDALIQPHQVYVTLWSHHRGEPGHVHWVVQPVTRELMASYEGLLGPYLQVAMFDRNEPPPEAEVEAIADRFRDWFAEQATAPV
jgi:diadenosine tetraphosphate (Ap4A) HIT family hydrolase